MSDLLEARLHHKRWQVLNHVEHLAQASTFVCTPKGLDVKVHVSTHAHGFLILDAVLGKKCVGSLTLDPGGDGEGRWSVHLIETHPSWVHRGIASALYAHALTLLGPIAHSHCRSIHGDGWAKAVGGLVPEAPITTMIDYEDFPLWLNAWMSDESTDVIDDYFPEV